MRLVAGLAGEAAGVLVGVDLREALGFGSAGRMAADAEDGGVELGRGDGGVVGVFRKRTVAGFAVDVGVLAGFFGVQDVRMAGLAGLVAGEMDGTSGNLTDCGSTVMAVFAKGLGHDEVPDNKEHEEGSDEQERKSEQMSCIFEKAHRINFPSRYGGGPEKLVRQTTTMSLIWE